MKSSTGGVAGGAVLGGRRCEGGGGRLIEGRPTGALLLELESVVSASSDVGVGDGWASAGGGGVGVAGRGRSILAADG